MATRCPLGVAQASSSGLQRSIVLPYALTELAPSCREQVRWQRKQQGLTYHLLKRVMFRYAATKVNHVD